MIALEILRILSWIFICSGAFFSIVGGIGIVRLPEFYSRLHGGGITDTMGAALLMVGLLCQVPASMPEGATVTSGILVAAKLIIILFFLMVTAPSSCHALAKSAYTQGLKPELDPPVTAANKTQSTS